MSEEKADEKPVDPYKIYKGLLTRKKPKKSKESKEKKE